MSVDKSAVIGLCVCRETYRCAAEAGWVATVPNLHDYFVLGTPGKQCRMDGEMRMAKCCDGVRYLGTQWGPHVSTGVQLKEMRAAIRADVAMARSTGLSAQSALYITDSVVWARVRHRLLNLRVTRSQVEGLEAPALRYVKEVAGLGSTTASELVHMAGG